MAAAPKAQETNVTPKRQREWAPRFWDGMRFGGWIRLLARNRFALSWQYWLIGLIITPISVFHTVWRWWQELLLGWWTRKAEVTRPPLFIIGHWRSGTTLLHELMVLDARHTFPTTFECFAPNHFLISETFAQRWLKFLLPKRRPMDNMLAGWDRPQEDEFALCNLGLPSPYLTVAFPNHPPQYNEYLTLENVPPNDLATWKQGLRWFLNRIAYLHPDQRIVLKSPPHTGRVKVLLEMFPDAQFVHIVRDPYVLYLSTINLWTRLFETQGLQKPNFIGIEEYVLDSLDRMYRAYEAHRTLIPAGNLVEVKYEDFTADTIEQMRTIYAGLNLGGFDKVLPKLQEYLDSAKDYQRNRYRELDPSAIEQINQRWGFFIDRYGYQRREAVDANASTV